MSGLSSPPLGALMPDTPHATVVCLPTLADVESYERKEPRVWQNILGGYPRFVRHPFVAEAARIAAKTFQRTGELFPLVSLSAAQKIIAWSDAKEATIDQVGDWVLVSTEKGDVAERFSKWVQHTGVSISSRQAEAYLQKKKSNPTEGEQAREKIRQACAPYFAGVPAADLVLTLSGMNAVAAAMAAVNTIQQPRGKKVWIQLGWLYVDSTRLLEKAKTTRHEFVADITNLAEVERLLAKGDVAGVLTEVPNNPQLEMADIPALRKLCDYYGAKLILDPSSVGLAILDPLPYADIVCCSLTKYAASEGDVMAGLCVVNPQRENATELLAVVKKESEPLPALDAVVLAKQISRLGEVSRQLSAQAKELAQRLAQHPAVAQVRTADTGRTAENFRALQRPQAGAGCLITIELKKDMRRVYDNLAVVKGPSFGLVFTIVSPFLWLAHFAEVTSPEGRASIRAAGLDPDLLRISVGLEPVEEIWAAFVKALK